MVISYSRDACWSAVTTSDEFYSLHRAELFAGEWGCWGYALFADGKFVIAYPDAWVGVRGFTANTVWAVTAYEKEAFPDASNSDVSRFVDSFSRYLHQHGKILV